MHYSFKDMNQTLLRREKICLRISDRVRYKPSCKAAEDCLKLKIPDLVSKEIVEKLKALISC